MAKQCIYCGRPLIKDDARFCNECGRSQVAPTSTGVPAGGASPSAIKVKLPPKEFTRADPSSAWQETSLPGQRANVAPVSPQRTQAAPLPTSVPKRPARSAQQEPPALVEGTETIGDASSPVTRLPGAGPTPAEEISTMVLPNWREELAQLRKGQAQADNASSVAPEKKVERTTPEPPPLPRHAPNTPFPSRETRNAGLPTPQPRPQAKTPSEFSSGSHVPQEGARPAEPPRRTPNTPLPQENTSLAEASRRELHVKVWEQKAPIQHPQVQEKKQEPGPAPSVEQNPLASVVFGAEEQVLKVENLETAIWQTPFSPTSASPSRPPLKEESRPPLKEERSAPVKEESRSPVREEARPAVKEENNRAVIEKKQDDIEDMPTVPLAVPEVARPELQIKVERASTPAPSKWSVSPTDEVEDLPTRPMTASSVGPASPVAPRSPQPAAAQQTQSGERRPEAGQADFAAPSGQRSANPLSSPGIYGQAPVAQAPGQIMETAPGPLTSRGRSTHPNSPPGPLFDPASLPPLPPGPLSAPGNPQVWSETQGPPPRPATPFPDAPGQRPPQMSADPFGQRPPQRSPAFGPPSASPSVFPNASRPTVDVAVEAEKPPRKKRHPGRILVGLLLVLVLAGGGVWYVLYQPFTVAAVSQPYQAYQNSAFGVSLDYTQGWRVTVDQAHSILKFADSTRTGQVTLTMAAAGGQVGDYLNQQVTQLQISGSKAAPAVTFAGSSWQVMQGTVTQSGATYTLALYATQHNGHFYMLAFQAPQSSFTHTDQNNFAHMRSSFSFI